MNANIYAKANQIIRDCDAAYLGVLDENGFPHVSTVSPIRPENLFEAYFATGLGANKTKRLRRDRRASVCYRADGDNITLVGEAEISPTRRRKAAAGWTGSSTTSPAAKPTRIIA